MAEPEISEGLEGCRNQIDVSLYEGIQMKSSKVQNYSSKILKSGAILSETKILLAGWDDSASIQDNFDRFRQRNILGKASRSRVEDILQIFRQRYLNEVQVTKTLITLIRAKHPADSLNQILYFHAGSPAWADAILEGTGEVLERAGRGQVRLVLHRHALLARSRGGEMQKEQILCDSAREDGWVRGVRPPGSSLAIYLRTLHLEENQKDG